MYVVKKFFKDRGVGYLPGRIIEDLNSITLPKVKVSEGKIVVLEEDNPKYDDWCKYFAHITGKPFPPKAVEEPVVQAPEPEAPKVEEKKAPTPAAPAAPKPVVKSQPTKPVIKQVAPQAKKTASK